MSSERRARGGDSSAANPVLGFALRFGVGLALAASVYPLLRHHCFEWLQALANAIARIEYQLFLPFASNVTLSQHHLSVDGFDALIIVECTGVFEVLIFVAAVLAVPVRWRDAAIGIAMGIPLIMAVNVLRLCVLIAIGRYLPAGFAFAHEYLWQGTWIVMVAGVWLLWISTIARRDGAALRPSPSSP